MAPQTKPIGIYALMTAPIPDPSPKGKPFRFCDEAGWVAFRRPERLIGSKGDQGQESIKRHGHLSAYIQKPSCGKTSFSFPPVFQKQTPDTLEFIRVGCDYRKSMSQGGSGN